MNSDEINYSNLDRAPTRLGLGPLGWFLVLDRGPVDDRSSYEREHRLLREEDITNLIAFYELARDDAAQ